MVRMACVGSAAMNTSKTKKLSRRTSALTCVMLMLVANVARPGAAVLGEELAVLRTIAAIVNRDATRPYENLYFQSEFEGASFVATSLENPDRNQFCGLTRSEALAMVTE